jgi:hypothetical protein
MPLTSFDYLKTRTNITLDLLYGLPRQPTGVVAEVTNAPQDVLWTSAERKRLHESYWGDVIQSFVEQNLAGFATHDSAWQAIHAHETFTGSRFGKRFAGRRRHWTALFTRQGRSSTHASMTHIPFVPFLYGGKVERISLRVLCLLRRQIFGAFPGPLQPGQTALFDLGSGWGRHALMFASANPGLAVHAGEISAAGRAVTQRLSGHFGIPVESFAFDYLDWQDMVARVAAAPEPEIVIFSSHAIEQVTFADLAMWERLATLPKRVRFVHLEPVGWQISANAGSPYSRPPKASKPVNWGYNKNLIAIVDRLQDAGLITDLAVSPDQIAFGHTLNSGTLVTFRNAGQR